MLRTQIYLTENEKHKLHTIAENTGKSQSKLIREAIDVFVKMHSSKKREIILKESAGIWRNRKDLPDFHKLREKFNRNSSARKKS